MATDMTVVVTSLAVQEFRLFGQVTFGSVAACAMPANPVQIQANANTAVRILFTVPPPTVVRLVATPANFVESYAIKNALYSDFFPEFLLRNSAYCDIG